MPTGWNYIWGESWKDYVSRSVETRDEERMHHASNKAMIGAISKHTASIISGMQDIGSQISSSIDKGVSEVHQELNELSGHMKLIAGETAELNANFQWGFGQMIAQMGGMNDSLTALIELAKTPAQTAAYEQFEIARDAFRQELYTECLESSEKAINGDHSSSGYKLEWRFHQMQGVIKLGFFGCDVDQVDSNQAEQAFLLAARYAKAGNPKDASKAYLSAGWSAYVQGKFPEALEHTQQAISLDIDLTEGYFQAAKINMAANNPDEALPLFQKAISRSSAYILKGAADGDFKQYEDKLNDFFETIKQEAYSELSPKITEALNEVYKWSPNIQHAILDRWNSILSGKWGLLDLLKYTQDDCKLVKVELKELERMWNTYHIETRTVKAIKDVEEPYDVEEDYYEDVVTRPKGWFKSEKVESVKGTRIVTKHRTVEREMDEVITILINQLGETKDFPKYFPEEFFKFVRIPAGRFLMGSPPSEVNHTNYDETQHEVKISRDFEMQTTPITQSVWEIVMGDNPSNFEGASCPVENVSWDDANEFINKINKLFHTDTYRLPTEAEWEYACRAGTMTPFWTGNTLTTDQANYPCSSDYARNSKFIGNSKKEDRKRTTPVKMFEPNLWGLYDMHGNVWEWCQDVPSTWLNDPQKTGIGKHHVCRGGSWENYVHFCRSATRNSEWQDYRSNVIGFRLCRSIC